MFKRNFVLVLSLAFLVSLFTSTAFAGEMQKSLLEKVQQPEKQLTKAEFVALLAQAAELPTPGKSVTLPSEVPADAWYAADLKAALAAGIYNGATPEQGLTKAQAVTFISRVLGTPNEEAPGVAAPESAKNHWSYVPYSWLLKDGIVNTAFNLEEGLTGVEGASLLETTFGTVKEAKAIAEQSQAAQLEIKTLRTNGDISMNIKANPAVPAQDIPANLGMKATFAQEVNYDQGFFQKFSMTMTGLPVPPVEVEQYIVNQGLYMKMPNPQTGQAEWLKMPAGALPDITEMLKQQSKFMQLPKELDQYFHYRLVGEEKIGDKAYHKLSFYGHVPDLSQFMKLIGGQMGITPEVMKNLEQSGQLIKGLHVTGTMLIEKDSNLLEKQNMNMFITMADQFEGQPIPFKSFSGNFNFTFKDYGSQIEIILPAEAEKAPELPVPTTQLN